MWGGACLLTSPLLQLLLSPLRLQAAEGRACVIAVNKWDTIAVKTDKTLADYEADVRAQVGAMSHALGARTRVCRSFPLAAMHCFLHSSIPPSDTPPHTHPHTPTPCTHPPLSPPCSCAPWSGPTSFSSQPRTGTA